MTKDEALNHALKLVSNLRTHSWTVADTQFVITAIKEALAQPEQESDDLTAAYMTGVYDGKKQRTWVGLTDEDLANCFTAEEYETARYWETKLKEKNNG